MTKRYISLRENCPIEFRFSKSYPLDLAAICYFGNIKGVKLVVSKGRLVGVRFENVDVFEKFMLFER